MKRRDLDRANQLVAELAIHEKIRKAGPNDQVYFHLVGKGIETFRDAECGKDIHAALLRYLDRRRDEITVHAEKIGLEL